jgi:pimeloyl-ACP methyl ester carboxylesterase
MIANTVYNVTEMWVERHLRQAGMKHYLKEITGDTIEYWDSGTDKTPLILIHGFGAESKYQWYKQVVMLSKQYRLIMPNLLYFGQTTPDSPRFEISDQVDLIRSLKNHLKIDKTSIIGVSYGGLISAELIRQIPNEISKLVLFDAPIKFMYHSDIDRVIKEQQVESVESLFVPNDAEGLKKLFYVATSSKFPLPASTMTTFYEKFYSDNVAEKTRLMEKMLSSIDEYQERDYSTTVPSLIVWGEDDLLIPVERAKLLKEHMGEFTQLEIIKGAGHMPNITKAKRFNQLISDFLV